VKNRGFSQQAFPLVLCLVESLSSVLMPVLAQVVHAGNGAGKLLLTIVAVHVAVVLGFHRATRVEERLRQLRQGELRFRDTYRRLLDAPWTFGSDEETQINRFFEEIDECVRQADAVETKAMPMVETTRSQQSPSDQALPRSVSGVNGWAGTEALSGTLYLLPDPTCFFT